MPATIAKSRTAQGSRQRVVAYLGELTATEQDGWAKLGSHLNGEAQMRRPQLRLFDPPRRDDEPLLVKLSSIRLNDRATGANRWRARAR